jgi:hypothetical protein
MMAWLMGLVVAAIPQFIRAWKTGTGAGLLLALAGVGTAITLMIETQGGVIRAGRFALNFALAAVSAFFAATSPSVHKMHELSKVAVVDFHRRLVRMRRAIVAQQYKNRVVNQVHHD